MDNKKFSGMFIPRASFYLWVIFVLVLVVSFLKWEIAVPGYMLLSWLVYYNFRSNYIRQKEITKYIENLTFNIDTATKDTLLNFPMPLVVIELDGTIIWYNSLFRGIFEGEQLLEKAIGSFVEELQPESFVDGIGKKNREVVINDKNYNILGNYVKIDGKIERDEYILMLYLLDNTELVDIKKRYEEEKICTGLIDIDNYDDLMQSMDDSMRPQMLAEIDKKIITWANFTGGIIKKFERDKYVYIFENKYFKEMVDKKFEILDSVKEINLGNKIPVTLSLGLGLNGKSPVENFHFSNVAMDIALGRGGDQVVVKNGENFTFYGGKTRELEKRTRVKARVIAYALRELIDQSPYILIMGHENGDLDSLGASMGLYRIAKNRGKDVHIVLSQSNPNIDNLVGKIQKSNEYEGVFIGSSEALDLITKKTLVIVVDTHKPSFTECPELLKRTTQVVVIDHHRKGADFIQDTVLSYQETYASSTCELVTEILQYVDDKIKLKSLEAEAIYAGIVVDTKNFSFKTGVRTFEAASYLRRQGVDTVSVKQLFQNDLNTYITISNVVRDAEIIKDNIAISVCPLNTKNPQLIAAHSADQLLTLSGINAAFVMSIVDDVIWISGRSLGDINVQVILEKLGGGGHMTIAGAQLQGVTMEEAKEKLKNVVLDNDTGSKDN